MEPKSDPSASKLSNHLIKTTYKSFTQCKLILDIIS